MYTGSMSNRHANKRFHRLDHQVSMTCSPLRIVPTGRILRVLRPAFSTTRPGNSPLLTRWSLQGPCRRSSGNRRQQLFFFPPLLLHELATLGEGRERNAHGNGCFWQSPGIRTGPPAFTGLAIVTGGGGEGSHLCTEKWVRWIDDDDTLSRSMSDSISESPPAISPPAPSRSAPSSVPGCLKARFLEFPASTKYGLPTYPAERNGKKGLHVDWPKLSSHCLESFDRLSPCELPLSNPTLPSYHLFLLIFDFRIRSSTVTQHHPVFCCTKLNLASAH